MSTYKSEYLRNRQDHLRKVRREQQATDIATAFIVCTWGFALVGGLFLTWGPAVQVLMFMFTLARGAAWLFTFGGNVIPNRGGGMFVVLTSAAVQSVLMWWAVRSLWERITR